MPFSWNGSLLAKITVWCYDLFCFNVNNQMLHREWFAVTVHNLCGKGSCSISLSRVSTGSGEDCGVFVTLCSSKTEVTCRLTFGNLFIPWREGPTDWLFACLHRGLFPWFMVCQVCCKQTMKLFKFLKSIWIKGATVNTTVVEMRALSSVTSNHTCIMYPLKKKKKKRHWHLYTVFTLHILMSPNYADWLKK